MINTGEHYKIYTDFVRDLRHNNKYPFIRYPEEYNGEKIIKLCPSQHQIISDYQQRKVTLSWVKYLSESIFPLEEVQVCTRMNQAVFDALCNQTNIKSLRIKQLTGKNIDNIIKLTNLKKLFIESGSSIEDITPLSELLQLEVLILGNTKKITDYSCIKNLQNLKVLGICAYQADYNTIIQMDSDAFISEMPDLEYVDMHDVKIKQNEITCNIR